MKQKKLDKLLEELARLRRAPQKATALEGLASRLGRTVANRGKHPMWENDQFPELRPLSIPHHGGRDLPIGTRNSILDQLEEDIAAWKETLSDEDDDENAR